jgi:hypothetical protein
MVNSTEFEAYCLALVRKGHDRHWIRHNAIALQERFARDPMPFDPVEAPAPRQRDRYEEL